MNWQDRPPAQTPRSDWATKVWLPGRKSTLVTCWYISYRLPTLNESLVLLSGCLQMTPVTSMQRRTDPVITKTAHSVPSARASLPSTATMHTVMISAAVREEMN